MFGGMRSGVVVGSIVGEEADTGVPDARSAALDDAAAGEQAFSASRNKTRSARRQRLFLITCLDPIVSGECGRSHSSLCY